MKQTFALDQSQMLPRRIDAFKPEPLANLFQRRNNPLAPLTLLNERIYFGLPVREMFDCQSRSHTVIIYSIR